MNRTETIHNRTAAEVMAETVMETVRRRWEASVAHEASAGCLGFRDAYFRAGAEWANGDTEILMAHVKELRAELREARAEIDARERGEA